MDKRPLPLSALRGLPEYEKIKYKFLRDSVTSAHLSTINDTISELSRQLLASQSSSSGKILDAAMTERSVEDLLSDAAARAGYRGWGGGTHRVFEETETLDWMELEEWMRLSRTIGSYELEEHEKIIVDVDGQLEEFAEAIHGYEEELVKIDPDWYENRVDNLNIRYGKLPNCDDYFEAMSGRCRGHAKRSHNTSESLDKMHREDFRRIYINLMQIYMKLFVYYGFNIDRPGYERGTISFLDWRPEEVREGIWRLRKELGADSNNGVGGYEYTRKFIHDLWQEQPNDRLIVTVSVSNPNGESISVHHEAELIVKGNYSESEKTTTLVIDDYKNNTMIRGSETKVFTLLSPPLDELGVDSDVYGRYGSGAFGAQVRFYVMSTDGSTSDDGEESQTVAFVDGSHGIR